MQKRIVQKKIEKMGFFRLSIFRVAHIFIYNSKKKNSMDGTVATTICTVKATVANKLLWQSHAYTKHLCLSYRKTSTTQQQ